jgi:hypothetical protein
LKKLIGYVARRGRSEPLMPKEPEDLDRRLLLEGRLGKEVRLKVSSLRAGESPRFVPEDLAYARALAELDATVLPPVLVRAKAMTVVDGWQLVLAARIRGEEEIRARMLHASEDEAFLISVLANVTHGKRLTVAERLRAASRLLESNLELSDGAIADACSLSRGTVTRLRVTRAPASPNTGVEPDGRKRRLSTRVARQEAAERMTVFPDDSNRKIARDVGVSEKTVRDVRRRIMRGESPSS